LMKKYQYQPDLPFNPPLPEIEDYSETPLKDMIYDLNGEASEKIFAIFNKYKINYSILDFNDSEKKIVVIYEDGKPVYVSDFGNTLWFNDANSWIWDQDEYSLTGFYPQKDNFWDDVGDGLIVYHGTYEENVENILKKGLMASSETRGLTNKDTGDAVFASLSPEGTDSYGNVIIQIDMGAMKRDGYMPEVSGEEPLQEASLREALAWKIGLEDFNAYDGMSSDGISEDTVVIFGNIPPKYLSIYK